MNLSLHRCLNAGTGQPVGSLRPGGSAIGRLVSWIGLLAFSGMCSLAAAQHPGTEAPHHPHWHSKPGAVSALRLLREGGNVVFIRHGKTDMLATDAEGPDRGDCRRQRNLSPMGREASREMGEAWTLLGLVAADVWSSPMCRCRDTAMLAFGRATPADDLAPAPGAHGIAAAGRALLRLTAGDVQPGANRIVVAHIFNALGALDTIPEEGEALILRPGPAGKPVIAGRLTATQWGDLVRDLLVFRMDLDSPYGREDGEGAMHPPRHSHPPADPER